jgi:hypothetical protein
MSTGRKWFLALALVSTFSFFMFMFPTKVDSAVDGRDIWLVPGFDGSVAVDTRVPAINGLWSGTLTLTVQATDGSDVATDSVESAKDWDETLSVRKSFSSGPKLHVSFRVRLPEDIRAGTLAGSVSGDIVTPQYNQGGFSDLSSTVDLPLAVHVADQATVTEHSDETQRWPLPSWMRWLLWLPLVAFVLTAEQVSTRLARRVNAR